MAVQPHDVQISHFGLVFSTTVLISASQIIEKQTIHFEKRVIYCTDYVHLPKWRLESLNKRGVYEKCPNEENAFVGC